MKCNLCGSTTWVDMNARRNAKCAQCDSLERTRAMALLLELHAWPPAGAKVLHFAPERGLTRWLQARNLGHYDAVDLNPKGYRHTAVRPFDLTKDGPTLPSDYYDLIVHSHVMEHVPCNLAYVFFHLHRALSANGKHAFCIPFLSGYYDEYYGPLSREEATFRFGQHDHVRRFGIADFDRHIGMLLRVKSQYSLYDSFDRQTLDECNIPESERTGLNASTVYVIGKTDYLLA